MKFKLDENMDGRLAELFIQAGHNIQTVSEQNMSGWSDEEIAQRCIAEGRCLITQDMDFANIISYPPENYTGLIVLRLPKSTLSLQMILVRQIVSHLEEFPLAGRLWIVEPGRIRLNEEDE
jgi:predicted nuclease of predicted toxin-antitoxin system